MLNIKIPEKHNTGNEIQSSVCVHFFNNSFMEMYLFNLFSIIQFAHFKYTIQEFPVVAQWVKDQHSLHRDVGLIAGLAQ